MNNKAEYTPEKVVDISNLSREDWLEYRKKGIGGSDVAAIMGISPFATIRDLFYNKTGVQPVIQEEEESNWVAKEVGHRLEDLVAEIFSKKTGLEVFPVRVMFRHPLYPFMLADVDFFVRMPDGKFAILECKTCNYNAKDKWADEGIPAHYVLQVRHYLSVMNMQKAFIACLYGNNENEFVYRTIKRDLIEEEDIIDQETYFWQEHVLKNVVPPHNGNSDLVLANIRNYGGFADKSIPEIVLSGLESKNLEKYLTLSEEKSQLEKRKKEIEAEQRAISVPFVEQLGQGCKAVLEDGTNRYRITDQETGKNFNRPRYTVLVEDVLRPGDILIITELDRLGRNKRDTMQQIQRLKEMGVRLMVLELPTTLMDLSVMDNAMARMMLETINNMMLELYASMAQAELEKKEKRQREGIEAKKLRGEWDDYGRPSVMKQETFDENFQSVVSGETTPTQLRKNLGMTHSTFYRYRKTFYEKYPELSNSAN